MYLLLYRKSLHSLEAITKHLCVRYPLAVTEAQCGHNDIREHTELTIVYGVQSPPLT